MRFFKINQKDIGVVFGTFAPMHSGHIELIHEAKKRHDSVIVIVSGYDGDRGEKVDLPLHRRFGFVRKVFTEDELVSIWKLDETDIPRYPDGWKQWIEKVDEILDNATTKKLEEIKFTFYVGELEYKDTLKKLRPQYNVVLKDRKENPISATKIRNNPYEYWNEIAQPFRHVFSKNILVLGSASNGKTTLVKDLARRFNLPYSLEYAREYQIKENVRDDELTPIDYQYLLAGQFSQTSHIIDSPANPGMVIADTNSTVTKAYIDYYLADICTDEELITLNMLYKLNQSKEKWDLILFVLPIGEYVDDGFRDLSMKDNTIREAFTKHLYDLLVAEGNKDKIVFLDGTYKNKTNDPYYNNYAKARDIIEEMRKSPFKKKG